MKNLTGNSVCGSRFKYGTHEYEAVVQTRAPSYAAQMFAFIVTRQNGGTISVLARELSQ